MSGSLFPTRLLVKKTNGFAETQGAKSISKGVLSDLCAQVLSAFEFYGAFGRPTKIKHGEDRAQVDVLVGSASGAESRQGKDGQSSGKPYSRKYCNGNEKPSSMPTSVRGPSESFSTSHSAMPRRVQYFRGLGGGTTSCGVVKLSAM